MMDVDNVGRVSKCCKRFEWSIPDFLGYARDHAFSYLHSPVFSSSEMDWKLALAIPWLQKWHNCINLDLRPINRHRDVAVTPVTFTLGIKTSDGEIVEQRTRASTLSEIEVNLEWFTYIEVTCTDLRTFKSTYLPSDTLTLAFHLEIGDGSVPPDGEDERTTQAHFASLSGFDSGTRQEYERQTQSVAEYLRCKNPIDKTAEKHKKSPKKLTRLEEDFKDLLLNETDSDVVFKVGGKEFKAHRVILRARSPVLFTMFDHDTEERRIVVVDIEDCDPDTFPDFLHYIYTGRMEALTERKTLHLYRTADKYQVMELKEQCLELLKRHLHRQRLRRSGTVASAQR